MSRISLEEAYRMGYATNEMGKRSGSNGSSNYLACPSLCSSCEHLIIENGTSPFKCMGSSRSAANQINRDNLVTFDGCKEYQVTAKEPGSQTSHESTGGSLGEKMGKGALKAGGKLLKGIWNSLG